MNFLGFVGGLVLESIEEIFVKVRLFVDFREDVLGFGVMFLFVENV